MAINQSEAVLEIEDNAPRRNLEKVMEDLGFGNF